MSDKKKIEYGELEAGYEFSPGTYVMDADLVKLYIQAVEDDSPLFKDTGIVPPMAVAANAIRALSEDISLPEGAVHVSEELEFVGTVCVGEIITCYSKVSKKQVRGKLHIMTVDFDMKNEGQNTVAAGKTSFILPQNSEGQGK